MPRSAVEALQKHRRDVGAAYSPFREQIERHDPRKASETSSKAQAETDMHGEGNVTPQVSAPQADVRGHRAIEVIKGMTETVQDL